MLKKSVVNFKFQSTEDVLKKNGDWFTKLGGEHFPEISVSYTLNNLGKLLGNIEIKRCGCESGFFKYIVNTGSDVGPFSSGVLKMFVTPSATQFYEIEPSFKIWKNFNKACLKYKKESTSYLKKNKSKMNELSSGSIKYITKHYSI